MIDLMPLVYVSLLGLGLVGAQAALSDNRFMLVLSAPPQLANMGYSRDVIEDLFLGDMEDVFHTRSAIATPLIASVREKTILGTMAEIARVGDLAFVIQQKIGGNPYKVTANFVVEDKRTQVLLSGYSASQGQFHQVIVGEEGHFRRLIRHSALEAARNIDPYFRALYEFERDDRRGTSSFEYVDSLINEELSERKSSLTPQRHSAFLNLRGLICLEKEDKACALAAFNAALAADPNFAIARLNRAFTLVELDRYQDAINEAQNLLGPPPMTDLKPCLAAARTLIGVAKWALGDIAGAQSQFSEAAAMSPKFQTPLVYWTRMLAATNQPSKELDERLEAREHDAAHVELYAEIAMLYYWLNEKNNQPITRRNVREPRGSRRVTDAKTSTGK
jgi:hypothetical protein